jgi:hypothetical protein
MPSKEIKELRQSGRLEEALEMAQNELEAAPNNIWSKRNISWVYYEYLKANASINNYHVFIDYLTRLKELNLPEDDKMVIDNSAFQIGKLLFSIQKTEHPDYTKINQIFDTVKNFHFTKPSESYSFLYKAFHKGYKNWSRYIEFAEWWKFSNFSAEDYSKQTMPNGKDVMSLVEQAYMAYAKKILEGEESDVNQYERVINKEKIINFLPQLDKIIDEQPAYQYPPYFKAKLLLELGDKDNVLASFIPFAKMKKNDFWVWELMSDIFEENDSRKLACLCKALSLKSPEDFLINTRQKLASLLIKKDLFNEAKTEIVKIMSTRQHNGWAIPNNIIQWSSAQWYIDTVSGDNNKNLYNKHIDTAEEILFQDIKEDLVIVDFINKDKQILNFIKDESLHGFFSYKNLNIKPKIGDILKIRLEPVGNEGFYKALTLKKADENLQKECKAYKEVSGNIRILEGKNFGFLEDVFVSPDTLKANSLKNHDNITAKAILSFNKGKNQWGWKVYEI